MKTIVWMNIGWACFFIPLAVAHGLIASDAMPLISHTRLSPLIIVLVGLGLIGIIVMFYFDFKVLLNPDKSDLERIRQQKMKREPNMSPGALESKAKSSYLYKYFQLECANAMCPGLFGCIAYVNGAPLIIAYAMVSLSYVCALYVLWRLHTSWKKIYLG